MTSSPPLWKIWRELCRIFWQITYPIPATWSLLTYLFGARYYDLMVASKVVKTPGEVPLGPKIAIYLIFPTSGLQLSHLDSLAQIRSAGYAPIVVSNLPLKPEDRTRLLPYCATYIERPNYGYDFGGYREAIKHLDYKLGDLERLAILNDSCWFPLPGSGNWFDAAESKDLDYVGAASNYGFDRPETAQYRDITWNYRTTSANFHYCSFALLISRNILRDEAFGRFWRGFPMTRDKTRTVRRGEIGLSQWVIRRGYRHGVTTDIAHLDQELDRLPTDRLREILESLIIPADVRLLAIKKRLLSAHDASRKDIIGLILLTVARQGSSYSLADYLYHAHSYSFLKKTPIYLDQDASDTTIRFLRGIPGAGAATILTEALALRADRAPKFAMPATGLMQSRPITAR